MNYIKDLRLFNKDENQTVNAVIEICPGTSNKNELVEPNNNYLKCVRQVEGVYPFYYGSFPQTLAGDHDPLDFIMFTDKEHKLLDVVKVDVIGAVRTIDDGEQDDKIICVESDCSLMDVSKQMKQALKFLKSYKGKNANMKIEKKLASMSEAEQLLKDANDLYKGKPITVKSVQSSQKTESKSKKSTKSVSEKKKVEKVNKNTSTKKDSNKKQQTTNSSRIRVIDSSDN